MRERTKYQAEVRAFLDREFSTQNWEFSLPHGWGNETYFAHGGRNAFFVKLGAPVDNYLVVAEMGLTPPVIASGRLEDGTSIVVQPYIEGRHPSRGDFRHHLEEFAAAIQHMQHSIALRRVLPEATSHKYRDLGLEALRRLRYKWEGYKTQVSALAGEVDAGLDQVAQQIETFEGAGTVASHNNVCNANWMISVDRMIYLIDLDAMTMDDPAADLGALLWWYYPPGLRPRFLKTVGCKDDEQFRQRMRMRMAMHCLDILLPREHSFDRFDVENFDRRLEDFRAILAGQENPQGYK